eukprot:1532609-Prymnesium_polylepis.1
MPSERAWPTSVTATEGGGGGEGAVARHNMFAWALLVDHVPRPLAPHWEGTDVSRLPRPNMFVLSATQKNHRVQHTIRFP